MASPLTGWLPQDDVQAYLHDVPMEQPGQKRKRISVDDTAAMNTTSAANKSDVHVFCIIVQPPWVSAYMMESGLQYMCVPLCNSVHQNQHLIIGIWSHKEDDVVSFDHWWSMH